VLVALRLEEIDEAELPVARLETITTVADLVGIVRGWSTKPATAEERDTLLPPEATLARTRSGTRRALTAARVVIPFGRAAHR
jgi:hypothetical protein